MSRKRIYHTEEERKEANRERSREWRRKNCGAGNKGKSTMFQANMFEGSVEAAELAKRNNELLKSKFGGVSC